MSTRRKSNRAGKTTRTQVLHNQTGRFIAVGKDAGKVTRALKKLHRGDSDLYAEPEDGKSTISTISKKKNFRLVDVSVEVVAMSRNDYDDLIDAAENNDAEHAYAVTREEETLPLEMVKRIVIARENPITVWREHRGMTQNSLAKAAGISAPYLNEIEKGRKPGSVKARRRIAAELDVDLGDIEPPTS